MVSQRLFKDLAEMVTGDRRRAIDKPVNQPADCINILPGADRAERRIDLFRRGETKRAAEYRSRLRDGRLREAEVGDGDAIILIDENIGGSQVAVNEPGWMDCIECLADLQ